MSQTGTSTRVALALSTLMISSHAVLAAGTYKVIKSFDSVGTATASAPFGGLSGSPTSGLFGTLSIGQTNGGVFELLPSGSSFTYKYLHGFSGSDGKAPVSTLFVDGTGNLLGTTSEGNIFQLMKTKAGFNFTIVRKNSNGYFYGNSNSLSANKQGVIYGVGYNSSYRLLLYSLKINATKTGYTYTQLFGVPMSTTNAGIAPWGRIFIDDSGNIFGTTVAGGTYGYGVVFQLSPPSGSRTRWAYKTLYNFMGWNDGENPLSGVTGDASGNLFGTAYYGGSYGFGTAFVLKKNSTTGSWAFNLVWAFRGGTGGANPISPIAISSTGKLYGTTFGGGSAPSGSLCLGFYGAPQSASGFYSTSGCGTLYTLVPNATSTSWSMKKLHDFLGHGVLGSPLDGSNPSGQLVIGTDGTIYGTTSYGGSISYGGTVYSYKP